MFLSEGIKEMSKNRPDELIKSLSGLFDVIRHKMLNKAVVP